MSLRRPLLLAAAVAAAALPSPATASAADCDKVASPGPGAAQKLVDSLAPGQNGCLHGGRYAEHVRINRSGTSDSARITIRSFPGEQAELYGRLYVPESASYVTFEGLKLNGASTQTCGNKADCLLPSPTVNGADIVFQDNDITNEHTTICFSLGSSGYGTARRVTIRRNRIHDCGQLPANNHEHGIYVTEAEDTQILDNAIYDNADRGIQLYPNADRTTIRGNVIDNNGVGIIFSGEGSSTSDGNIAENNVITNSNMRRNVESWWPSAVGTGNVARNNCIHGGKLGNIGTQEGFVAIRNLMVDPQYVDRAAKDFRLKAGSPCAAVLAGAEVPAAPIDETSVPGGDAKPPVTQPGDGGDTTTGKPGKVVLENVSVKPSKRRGRARVRVAGRVSGDVAQRIRVQVRRGGGWKTIAAVPNVKGTFRLVLRAHVGTVRSARRMTIRVVGSASKSNAVRARVS
ncbi:MAG TPA: right-handed parallel beta-helix repeat-containing protein [Thermoleophilaceae bacterium]|jgi:parallel beta-helix repeat protein